MTMAVEEAVDEFIRTSFAVRPPNTKTSNLRLGFPDYLGPRLLFELTF